MSQIIPLRKLAAILYPKPIKAFDQLNWNAKYFRWIKAQGNLPSLKTKLDFYKYINEEIIKKEAIDYLEFEVYRGASIKKWTEINTNKDSRFYGFDSFEGLPEDGYKSFKEEHFTMDGSMPEVYNDRITFIKGWFQDSLPEFKQNFNPRNRLVIHNDSDLYSSTLYVLTQLNTLLCPGSVVIFDEFCVADHEFRALIDYSQSYQRTYKVTVTLNRHYVEKIAIVMD